MWHSAVLAVVFALLPGSSLGDVVDDPVEAQLERELLKLEHEGHHRRHNSHPRRKHFLGLLGHDDIVPTPGGDAQFLPGRHPAVAKKLERMDQEMHNLKERQHVAANARSNLEGELKASLQHMNSVVTIKIQLAKTEVLIRSEEKKLKRLAADRLRLDTTHRSLSSSLHHIMEPKIKYADARLQKKMRQLRAFEARDDKWKNKAEKFHASALAMLGERQKSKVELEAALVAEEKAHQERKAAEKKLGAVKKYATFDIEGYRYSETEERASMSKKMRGKDEASQADASVKRLTRILHAEERRVDASMTVGKDRVQHKMRQLEEAKTKSNAKLSMLRREYAEWQAQQQAWATHLATAQHSTGMAAKDFADTQEAGVTSAMHAAAEALLTSAHKPGDLVSDGGEDIDWAWDA